MTLPHTMRHADHGSGGGPEAIRIVDGPVPTPAAGQVLIKVAYAGVNRPDVAQRSGSYPPPKDASPILGLEVAGQVVAVGEGTARWKVGDAVCALTHGGGYAEYCVAPIAQCLPIPQGLSDIEAAALPETFFTVWQNVFEIARLAPGETLLVQGGSSGIGVTAIALAKALGSSVIVTAGTDEKCQACLKLGADHAINYKTQDFVAEVKRLTQGKGVNVVLDMVAGDYIARELQCVAEDGRIAVIATQGGNQSAIDAGLLLRKRIALTGSTLRPRPIAYKAVLAQALKQRVWPLLESGAIRPVIHQVFEAAQAAQAHALMESSSHVGKIVLRWS